MTRPAAFVKLKKNYCLKKGDEKVMSSREIKHLARAIFKPEWGRYVMVTLIFMIIMLGLNSIISFVFPVGLLLLVPIILIVNALQVLYIHVIAQYMEGNFTAWFTEIIPAIISNAMHYFVTKLSQGIYLFLWTCLFFFPGVYKAISYALVDYVLVDFPELSANETIALSRRLMRGQKLKWLMLQVRFCWWYLLIPLTCGIVAVYVIPYRTAAMVIFYQQCLEAFDIESELAAISQRTLSLRRNSGRSGRSSAADEDEWKNF